MLTRVHRLPREHWTTPIVCTYLVCSFHPHMFQSHDYALSPCQSRQYLYVQSQIFFWKLLAWKTQPPTQHLPLSIITSLTSLHWSYLRLALPSLFLFTGPHNKHPDTQAPSHLSQPPSLAIHTGSSLDLSTLLTKYIPTHHVLPPLLQPYPWPPLVPEVDSYLVSVPSSVCNTLVRTVFKV